ncbi:MAG: cyclase family protein [Gammaproteobacteria bacterium]|nr:cyclase family protein [Gammaproteobacteria bacterium]
MPVFDLTLPINRHMRGIPSLREYEENPTKCVVLTCMGEKQKQRLLRQGVELSDDLELTLHMTSRLEILTHIGTHVDAPCHFLDEDDRRSVDQIPPDQLVGPGRVVPLTHLQPRQAVTADAIIATGVEIDSSVIPVLYTGWTERAWGTDAFWNESIYLDVSAAGLLLDKGVKAVALDCFPEAPFWLGIEADQPPGRNHKALLGNGAIIIQMVTNIRQLKGRDFTLVAAPLPLEGLDGSPARVLAIVD